MAAKRFSVDYLLVIDKNPTPNPSSIKLPLSSALHLRRELSTYKGKSYRVARWIQRFMLGCVTIKIFLLRSYTYLVVATQCLDEHFRDV